MKHNKLNLIYFSATATTKNILRYIAEGTGMAEVVNYDITRWQQKEVSLEIDEIAIFGVPVYAGRIPGVAAEALKSFKGKNTPAIVVCVYGNRDFDDALLELNDIIMGNGFKIISAAAFVAQHSIFPVTGSGRPDGADKKIALGFGHDSMIKLNNTEGIDDSSEISVKGNFPYKEPGAVPIKPKANKKCNSCGTCARLCPVQAIDEDNPRKTNDSICISCARCIYVCPEKARYFGGLIYKIASRKFAKAYSDRKEPYLVL